MSFSNAFGAPFHITRDNGETLPVRLLTMEEIATIAAKIEAQRESRLLAQIGKQKLAPEAAARHRELIERQGIEIYDVWQYARSLKGQDDILAIVLKPDELALLSAEERIAAAVGACGWKPEKPEGKQNQNPYPPNGQSSGT